MMRAPGRPSSLGNPAEVKRVEEGVSELWMV